MRSKYPLPQLSNPLLHASQRTHPPAKKGPCQNKRGQQSSHDKEFRRVSFLNVAAIGEQILYCYNTAEWTNRMKTCSPGKFSYMFFCKIVANAYIQNKSKRDYLDCQSRFLVAVFHGLTFSSRKYSI